MIVDVINGEIALTKGDDALTNRVLVGLILGAARKILEEGAFFVMAEVPAETAKGTVLVTEATRGLSGGKSIGEKGPQGLVLALTGVGRFLEEPGFRRQ